MVTRASGRGPRRRFAALAIGLGSITALAPASAAADAVLAVVEEVAAPPVRAAGITGTGLDMSYRCGSATSTSGVVGVPALVGSCVFETVATTFPTGSGSFNVDVIVTPVGTMFNQVVAVGYREYNLGVRLDGVVGSPLRMTLSVSPVSITSGFNLCDAQASVTFSIMSGGSRIRSIEGSKGPGIVSASDPIGISAAFSTFGTAGPAAFFVNLDGVCGGNKVISMSLPSGLVSLSGRYNPYTFSFTGPPTSITATIQDVSSSTKRFTLTHNSSTMSGSVNLVTFGTVSFTNAPRSFDVTVVRDGAGDLSTLTATASNAPGSGTNVLYNATINGIVVHIDIRAISSATVFADLPNKRFSGDIRFVNRAGFIDADVTGSWKGIGYNVQLDGSGIGRVFLGVASSSPNVDFWANLRACTSGCGSVSATVNLNFFGILDIGPGFRIERLGSGQYNLVVPDPLIDTTASEGQCFSWLFGRVRLCALA